MRRPRRRLQPTRGVVNLRRQVDMAECTYRDDHGKTCTRCDVYKPYEQYYHLRTTRDGRQSWCKACTISYNTAKNRRNGTVNASKQRKQERVANTRTRDGRSSAERVHYTYHISLERAERLRAIPLCQCCNKPISVEDRTHTIDHDYDRGQVRGVLCIQCNTGIGKLGDSLDGIEQAAYYLVQSLDVLSMMDSAHVMPTIS